MSNNRKKERDIMILLWQTFGLCEYEYDGDQDKYTGWCRRTNGRLANGKWPEWNNKTGQRRYG